MNKDLEELKEKMLDSNVYKEEVRKSMIYLTKYKKITKQELQSLYNVCDEPCPYNHIIDDIISYMF